MQAHSLTDTSLAPTATSWAARLVTVSSSRRERGDSGEREASCSDSSSLLDSVTSLLLMDASSCSVAEPSRHLSSSMSGDHAPEAVHSLWANALEGPLGQMNVVFSPAVVWDQER